MEPKNKIQWRNPVNSLNSVNGFPFCPSVLWNLLIEKNVKQAAINKKMKKIIQSPKFVYIILHLETNVQG